MATESLTPSEAAHKKATAEPSWSERHPALSCLVGFVGFIAAVLTVVYAAGDGAVVGGSFRLAAVILRWVAVEFLALARDAPSWFWLLCAAAPALRHYESVSNQRWNIIRELLEDNCNLLAQVRDELRTRR